MAARAGNMSAWRVEIKYLGKLFPLVVGEGAFLGYIDPSFL
jgi:hypothetical protein